MDTSTRGNGWLWVLWPAAVMSLGWGLRGYIGGGPLGAMIPGALVALALCLLLGYRREAAALAAAFGAVGVGFGGGMTYGQTIGYIRELDTAAWGLAGLTLKGAVWGLLGGAVLAMGLLARHLTTARLAAALLWLLLGCILGIGLINEPKLLYFSGPDEPRAESWAGLLFGALALLVYLQRYVKEVAPVAWRFALYGFAAGGIGFGGGGLWMLLGMHVETLAWLPWWKFMEFTFGFCLGAGFGLCALHLRDQLLPPAKAVEPSEGIPERYPILAGGALIIAALFLWPMLAENLGPFLRGLPLSSVFTPLLRTLLGFPALGCLLLLVALRREGLAWQIAAGITFVATIIDLQRDWGPEGGLEVAERMRAWLVVFAWLWAVLVVVQWRRRPWRLHHIFLLTLWAVMVVGYLKGVSTEHLWKPAAQAIADAGGRGAFLYLKFRSELIVHALFTSLVIASTLGVKGARSARLHR